MFDSESSLLNNFCLISLLNQGLLLGYILTVFDGTTISSQKHIVIVRNPVILITNLGWTGVILTLRIGIVGFSRMTGRPSCLKLTASVMMEGDMAKPIRLRQDSWDASVLVADIDSGPVLDFLSPETEGMERLMEREDSRTNDFQELPRDSSGLSCDFGC